MKSDMNNNWNIYLRLNKVEKIKLQKKIEFMLDFCILISYNSQRSSDELETTKQTAYDTC